MGSSIRTVLLFTVFASALFAAAPNPVTWSLRDVPKKPLSPGQGFTVRVEARIDAGWHLYALDQPEGGPVPTEFSVPEDAPMQVENVKAQKPVRVFDSNFNQTVTFYTGNASFTVVMKVKAEPHSGKQDAVLQVRYQSCNEVMCLAPKTVDVAVPTDIRNGG